MIGFRNVERAVLAAMAFLGLLLLAPTPAHAAGCDVASLQKAIGRITAPLAPLKPSQAARQVRSKASELERLAARARAGALDDPDAGRRIACARLAVEANLALSFVDQKRSTAARTIAEVVSLGVEACDSRPDAAGADATDCAILRRQQKLASARIAVEDLAALQPKPVNAATLEMSPETWRGVGAIMSTLSRTVGDDWPLADDASSAQKLAILCRLVSVATTRKITSWRPLQSASEDNRGDAFERHYSAVLSAGAVQLDLKVPEGECADPARRACQLARKTAVQARCDAAAR